MAWSPAIDTVCESGLNIKRSFQLELKNGYQLVKLADWTVVPLRRGGFEFSGTEGVISISNMRIEPGLSDFTYFDEFDSTNPLQLATACRLQCTVYLPTTTVLGGTVTFVENSRTVTGVGTAFLTDLQPGDLIFSPVNPAEQFLVYAVIDNFNIELATPLTFSGGPGAVIEVVDAEREYIFHGIGQDRQESDLTQLFEFFDPLFKLNNCLSPIDREAELVAGSPYSNVDLRQAPGYDTPPEIYHYEIDAALFPWAETAAGLNRAFQPGVFQVEEEVAPAVWELVPAGDYQISEPLGLIIFLNDQGPVSPNYRLVSVSVYQEGTLEYEDILEDILRYSGDCPYLGFGADSTLLEVPLTGIATFVAGGPPYVVTGAGCAFDTELEVGDRIAFVGGVGPYGIVSAILGPNLLHILYPFGGPLGVPGPIYKSTLKTAGITISKIMWRECQGYAADLIRELHSNYAEFRGYRLWFDHIENKIIGEPVAIDPPPYLNTIDLGPSLKDGLPVHSTLENFNSAIAVKGTVGRALNLMSDPTVVITDLATPLGFSYGAANGGGTGWGGMYWGLAVGTEYRVKDEDLSSAFMMYRLQNAWDDTAYWDLFQADLGASFDLYKIIVYMPNCKNKNQWDYGISLFKAQNPAGPWTPVTPETFEVAVDPNGTLEFDVTGATARYIKMSVKPIKWVSDGGARTIGVREVQIFGSEEFCEVVCIQNTDPAGGHYVGGDPAYFISDYYPALMDKLAHIGHLVYIDDSGLVFNEAQARDRGYILLNEYIRLYREINWRGAFDPRIKLYQTVRAIITYRTGAPEVVYFLVESVSIGDDATTLSGREYGAGVLS